VSVEFREIVYSAVTEFSGGRIYLHSMPARFEPWSDFVKASLLAQVKHILCLTSVNEIGEKSPQYLQAINADAVPAQFKLCPVADFSTPEDIKQYRHCIEALAAKLRAGDNVLIHCAAGIGRTGTAAVCLLMALSVPTQQAIDLVAQAGSRTETDKQLAFINHDF